MTVDLTNATYTSGEGNVIVKGKGNDFYIMLVPTQDVTLGFSVTIGEVEYAGSLIRSIINASDFYRDGTDNSNGVPVKMEKVGGEEPENPDNPGNLDNWGGDVDYPILEKEVSQISVQVAMHGVVMPSLSRILDLRLLLNMHTML